MADYNISQYKITTQDKQGKLVSELDDFPSLSASALKARFDALGANLIIPRFNDMLDDLQLIVNALKGQEFHATRYAISVGSAATYVDITTVCGDNDTFPFLRKGEGYDEHDLCLSINVFPQGKSSDIQLSTFNIPH